MAPTISPEGITIPCPTARKTTPIVLSVPMAEPIIRDMTVHNKNVVKSHQAAYHEHHARHIIDGPHFLKNHSKDDTQPVAAK
ncbi:hypothetical protein ADUPG1_001874 [Aduncisulcus paluster]|uniref:Uncharacterized protein n=1 Tax=Aduncisulcus paluster TaxID=2918883 RepID=A0ABQ5KF51_9EUKA|nr:hypothetical protein ADUPG1_001874 [Aduncisulcus paluster]